jgi:archaemetzincin
MADDGPGVREVHLLPLDGLERPLAEEIAARMSRSLSAACRIVESGSGPLSMPTLPGRDQLDADALLAALEAVPIADDAVLVGLTTRDIALPIFTFVFGRARQGARAALVSLTRLDAAFYGLPSDPDSLAQRATNEIVHELGHLASLAHCPDASCLMSFAGSVEKVDVRGSAFCDACRGRLPQWLLLR